MTGFALQISGVGSNRSTSCATTTADSCYLAVVVVVKNRKSVLPICFTL